MGRKKRETKLKEAKEKTKNTEASMSGQLVGDKVVIKEDFKKALSFYDRGSFGEIHGTKEKHLELALVEALYLLERSKLRILDGRGKDIPFEILLAKAQRSEANFYTRWRVYRDFRSRGYVLKTALKFGW